MALDLSKFKFLSRLDARARIFVLVGAVIGLIALVYIGTQLLSGGSTAIGPSRVANAPAGLTSISGGQLTPEYYRTLRAVNIQSAQTAIEKGTSAVPTLIRVGEEQPAASCIVCTEDSANVSTLMDDWVRQGKLPQEVADSLQQLAARNVTAEEYAAELDRLVQEGKLTPEQARQLLSMYKKQHANALITDSAKLMDQLIKSGQLPLDVANELLDAQRNKISPSDYAALLQRLVREGKISPDVAQRLLAQYSQQFAKEVTMQSIVVLQQMAKAQQITPDIEKELISLENQMVPFDSVADVLNKYVTAGKLIPAVSKKILDEYKMQKTQIGSTATMNQLVQGAEAQAEQAIDDLIKQGKLSPEVGTGLKDMMKANVPLDVYAAEVEKLVKEGKISPEEGKRLIANYAKVKNLRAMMDRLAGLQANNVPAQTYAEELKRAVQAGIITPEQAAQLMQEYQAMLAAKSRGATVPIATGPGSEQFAALQQRLQQEAATTTEASSTATAEQFAVAQTQTVQANDQQRLDRMQALLTAMSDQAQQLVAAWQPPVMQHVQGTAAVDEKALEKTDQRSGAASGSRGSKSAGSGGEAAMIKSGSILFAVLDTVANSDYPDSPIMATIVDGKYKGATLLGKLVTAKGVSGQMDRISLNFTLMNMESWPKSKTVTAYAIDPDTARTALASQVNYHYMQRFGAMFATAFMQGYANAITTSASTSTTGIFGTTTSHPALSPSQKIAVGLGQVGQSIGQATQHYINRPPTVRVDSGVSLGILFMSDVS